MLQPKEWSNDINKKFYFMGANRNRSFQSKKTQTYNYIILFYT